MVFAEESDRASDKNRHGCDSQDNPGPSDPFGPSESSSFPGWIGGPRQIRYFEQSVTKLATHLSSGSESMNLDVRAAFRTGKRPIHSGTPVRQRRLVERRRRNQTNTSRLSVAAVTLESIPVVASPQLRMAGAEFDFTVHSSYFMCGSAVQWPISQPSTSASMGLVSRWEQG